MELNRPPLSPPGWLFPIVWTILYILMGVSSYLIIHSKPLAVYPICFVSLFTITSALWAIRVVFKSAGWLIAALVLFTPSLLTVMLLYLAISRVLGKNYGAQIYFAITASVIIGLIDYLFVSPFLAELIDSYETMGRYAIHVGLDRCI